MNETNGMQVERIIDIDRLVCEKEISLEDFCYSSKDLDAPYSKHGKKKRIKDQQIHKERKENSRMMKNSRF